MAEQVVAEDDIGVDDALATGIPGYIQRGAGRKIRRGESMLSVTVAVTMRLARLDFEGEFVVADADAVTIGQGSGGANSLVLHLDSVGRAQIADDEAGSGVDDDGVVAAHVGVIENDVVIGQAPDPGGGPTSG